MKPNKQKATTIVVMLGLLLFIAWRFVEYLGSSEKQATVAPRMPAKAVMAQAEELNQDRLEQLVEMGQIAPGMSMAQVKMALGEPSRSYIDSSSTQVRSIWWYEYNREQRKVYFGGDGIVAKIE